MLVPRPNLTKLGMLLLISTTFVVCESKVLSWGTLKSLAEYTVKDLGNKVYNFARNTTNDFGKKVRILEDTANITIGNQVRDLGKKVRDLEEAASINLGNRVHDLGSKVHDFARNTTQDVGNKVENLGTKVSDFARNTTKDLENKVRNLEDAAAAAANIFFGSQVEDLGNKARDPEEEDTVKHGEQVILGKF
jgi:hypothetical protein